MSSQDEDNSWFRCGFCFLHCRIDFELDLRNPILINGYVHLIPPPIFFLTTSTAEQLFNFKHLRRIFRKWFRKKLHLRLLNCFWIRLWKLIPLLLIYEGFLYWPDPDRDAGPRKTGPPTSNLLKNQTPNINRPPILNLKYQTSVKQKTDLIFRGLIFHNKYIDAGQKCISLSAKGLRQQANELCTLDGEGKCKRAGRNCIGGVQHWKV